MASTNRQRLEFAAAGFLNEMRKQHARLHPGDDCPIRNLTDYPPEERSALMAAVEKAIQFAGAGADPAFEAWLLRREERAASAT